MTQMERPIQATGLNFVLKDDKMPDSELLWSGDPLNISTMSENWENCEGDSNASRFQSTRNRPE